MTMPFPLTPPWRCHALCLRIHQPLGGAGGQAADIEIQAKTMVDQGGFRVHHGKMVGFWWFKMWFMMG